MMENGKRKSKSSHVTKGSVFDDLGFSEEESSALKVKAQLYQKLLKLIERRKYTPRTLEKLLDQPQPRVSELLSGKVSKMSIEKLLSYLDKLGGQVNVEVKFKRVS